jgi:phosphatidate cytidylyltransferase
VPEIYIPKPYSIPVIGSVGIADAQFHAAIIALFSAVIAPFGGFFASGLKRSMKLKDFSDSIPGHGGFADRFDCHIVCAFFVYMYLTQVVYRQGYTIERVFDYISRMDDDEKRRIFEKLKVVLQNETAN